MLAIDRITSNPNIMNGKSCIRGMRVTVSIVLNLLANGMSKEIIWKITLTWNRKILSNALIMLRIW